MFVHITGKLHNKSDMETSFKEKAQSSLLLGLFYAWAGASGSAADTIDRFTVHAALGFLVKGSQPQVNEKISLLLTKSVRYCLVILAIQRLNARCSRAIRILWMA